jgi:chaperonin GroES
VLDSGERQVPSVAVGDKVLYGKYSGTEIKYGGIDYLIVREDDILAKLED